MYSFENNSEYIYDVRWSPTHPSLFASVDGSGKLDMWNLNLETEVFFLILVLLLLCELVEAFSYTVKNWIK